MACISIYRGDWFEGSIQGCGVTISRKNDGGFAVQEGQFVEDSFFGPMLSCYEVEARNSAKEADAAAAKARGYVRQVHIFGCILQMLMTVLVS